MKLRKQFYKILTGGRYLIVINQLVANEENYNVCIKEYNGDDVLVKEYIRAKTTPSLYQNLKLMNLFKSIIIMARTTSYRLKTTHFDFRRARIRSSQDGKTWRIVDKFGVCNILQHIDYYKYMYAYDIHNYPELKQILLDELKEAKYPNIHIITNEED